MATDLATLYALVPAAEEEDLLETLASGASTPATEGYAGQLHSLAPEPEATWDEALYLLQHILHARPVD